MGDELRDRVLAAVRKGLAGPLSKTKKPRLQGYGSDFASEKCVTAQPICNTAFPNKIKDVTPLRQLAANSAGQPEQVCAVCGAAGDLWTLDTASASVVIHEECARILPQPEPAEPTVAYRSVSADPSGTGCRVTIVEIPREAGRYRRTFAYLQIRPPAYIEDARWRQCIEDGRRFLAKWSSQAEALCWDSRDLFGLHAPPAEPHPSYRRLSRYGCTGLVWLLEGREVIALTADSASIRNHQTGVVTTYRRLVKPALGPLGDSLEDLK